MTPPPGGWRAHHIDCSLICFDRPCDCLPIKPHVCGLTGYNPMVDPPCEGTEKWEHGPSAPPSSVPTEETLAAAQRYRTLPGGMALAQPPDEPLDQEPEWLRTQREAAQGPDRPFSARVPAKLPDEPLDAETERLIDAFCDTWTAPEGLEEDLRALVREVLQPVEQERDEARRQREKAQDQIHVAVIQTSNANLRSVALEARLADMEESIAEEVGTNLRIAERIGILEAIRAGKSYEDAEVEAFDSLRAKVADLEERGEKLDFVLRETASHELGCDVIVHGPNAACSCEYQIVVAALDGWAKRAK